MLRIFLIFLSVFSFTKDSFSFNLEDNFLFYKKTKEIVSKKFKNDFNINISLLEHPEISAGDINVSNVDSKALMIKHDYKKYYSDEFGLNFAEFKEDLLNKLNLQLEEVQSMDIEGKNVNILVPHMIDLNKLKNSDKDNKFSYFVNTDAAYIFLISPADYGVFIKDIIATINRNLKDRNIKFGKIHYISPACGVDAKNASTVLKKYKTQNTIGTLKYQDGLLYVEKSSETLGDKAWNYLKNDKQIQKYLKDEKIKLDVSFCNVEHCYCRTPEDMLEFAKNNKNYHIGNLIYNGVGNFVLGAVSLWQQEKDYEGFVSKRLVDSVKAGKFKLDLKPNSSKYMVEHPTVNGGEINEIYLEDFALNTRKIS